MRIVGARPQARRAHPLANRKRVALLLVAAWSVLVFAIGAATHATGFFGIVVRPLLEGGAQAPVRWLRARLATPPRFDIDMRFEDFQKLTFEREKALKEQALFASDDEYVPATIRSGDEDVKVKMRLKGDSPAHLQGEKWSFRVEVKGDHALHGLKRFSLQHPATRNYLSEWIYHRALLREDVLGLRYEFVDVTLNGNHLGIYALEEHFEKQLVEQKRRRDGPLLRFDEELMWREVYHVIKPFEGRAAPSGYGSYEASAIDGFKTDQTLADPDAKKTYLQAVRLLEDFRRGKLRTSEVFDTKRLATYFALTDLLGAEHGARWHNMRFYFNPITLRLEPIGFDAECTETTYLSGAEAFSRDANGRMLVDERPFHSAIFADRDFYKLYISELERVAQPAYLDALLADIGPDLDAALLIVQREFPQIEPPFAMLRRNQAYIRSVLDPVAGVRADLASAEGGRLALELANLQVLPVEVLGVELAAQGGASSRHVALPAPVLLEPRPYGELVHFAKTTVPIPNGFAAADLVGAKVEWRVLGSGVKHGAELTPYSPLADADAEIDTTHRAPNLARFPFVHVDSASRRAEIAPGAWTLDESMIVPAGLVLRAGPGTRLDLRQRAKIVSRSPLEWRGTASEPIEVFSSDATGQGVVVLDADGDSVLEHVVFRGLRPVDEAGWTLTGAVTFFESPVTVQSCEFAGNQAEDAFNGVRSRVRVDDTVFRDTTSDAFDCDFCEIELTNSRFFHLTNDGIDVSGSTARVDNVTIEDAGDKGISTGEASDLTATRVSVTRGKVGIASKDRSTLTARDLTLRDCQYGIAAFQKKPEFGPAQVHISELHQAGVAAPNLIQAGSTVVVDGEELPPSEKQNIHEILYGEPASASAKR